MDRRYFAIAAISSAGMLLGCDTAQKPSPTATLTNNDEIQQALEALAAAIDGLEGDVGDFDTENWRDVVPRVRSASRDVSGCFSRLRTALGVSGAR